jgi:hypothetical protein
MSERKNGLDAQGANSFLAVRVAVRHSLSIRVIFPKLMPVQVDRSN